MTDKAILIFSAYMNSANNAVILAKYLKKHGVNVVTISWGEDSKYLIEKNSNLFTFHGSHEDVIKSVDHDTLNEENLLTAARKMEEKLGCLKKYIFADRFLCNCFHEDVYTKNPLNDNSRLSYVIHWASYIEDIIQRYNVYSIISYTSSSAPMLLAADIIRLHGGLYTQMLPTRIPDRLAFCDGYNEEHLIELCQKVDTDKINNALIHTKEKVPTWAKFDYSPTKMVNLLFKKNKIFSKNSIDIKKIKSPFHFDLSLSQRILNHLLKRWRDFRSFEYDVYRQNENYISYFMHKVPEAAISVHAQYYEDEFSIIANIARSLPLGIKLYVKDHPHMQWNRNRNLYKNIKSIPSVRLLDPDTPVAELIENSLLCITKTGTPALQAFWAGRPSLVFGDAYYNVANGIHRFNEPMPSLHPLICKLIEKTVDQNDQFSLMTYLLQNSLDISSEKFLGTKVLNSSEANLIVNELRNAKRF